MQFVFCSVQRDLGGDRISGLLVHRLRPDEVTSSINICNAGTSRVLSDRHFVGWGRFSQKHLGSWFKREKR